MARGLVAAIVFGALSCAALAAPVLAAPRDDVRAGSNRCDAITDDRAWLDCYYGAAQPMRARLGLPPAPATQVLLVPPPAQGAAPAAAAVAARTPAPEPPDAIDTFFHKLLSHENVKAEAPTRMASYAFDKSGFFTVTLANGEVWRQSSVDQVQATWKGKPASYVVRIVPGPKMNVGAHETYVVERIR